MKTYLPQIPQDDGEKTPAWLNQAQSPSGCKNPPLGRLSPPLELPYPFYWEGFEAEAFRRRPDDLEPGAPVGEE